MLSRISLGFLLLFPLLVTGQLSSEKGYPPITNYSSKEYDSQPQNFDVVQDDRGMLFFANNSGLLEFDGIDWRVVQTGEENKISAVSKSEDGTVYIGAYGEIGVLAADAYGSVNIKSLNYLLPDSIEYGPVWKVHSTDAGVYFQADRHLFLYHRDSIKIWFSKDLILNSFHLHDNLYLHYERNGLKKMTLGKIVPVPFGEKFSDKRITAMTPTKPGRALLATKSSGLFEMELNVYNEPLRISPFSTAIDGLLKQESITNLIPLGNDMLSIGTSGAGLIIMNEQGQVQQVINKKTGLQDLRVNAQYKDDKGNIWLALNNGISKVEETNPVTTFGSQAGLTGTVEEIIRHNGLIHCATHDGVFVLSQAAKGENDGFARFQPEFEQLVPMQCWDIISVNVKGEKQLLGAFNDGVYHIHEDGSTSLIYGCYPWELHQLKSNPNVVLIGLDPGLGFIRYKDGEWEVGNNLAHVNRSVFNFNETDGGRIWCGTFRDGVVYGIENVSLATDTTLHFEEVEVDSSKQLPVSAVYSSQWNKYELFGTDYGLYTYDEKAGGFRDFEEFTPFGNQDRYIHRIKADHDDRLWMITVQQDDKYEFGYAEKVEGQWQWRDNALKAFAEGIVHALHVDSGDVAWLGGTEGLYRLDLNIKKDYQQPFNTYIRRVVLNRDSNLFNGTFTDSSGHWVIGQPPDQIPYLGHKYNNFTFGFSAFSDGNPEDLRFSYQLTGFDEDWTHWNSEPKAVYTNLEPGEYTFNVKAKNIYDVESPANSYSFIIEPPWYKTPWYYLGQFGFFGLLIFFTVYLNRANRDSEWTAIITFVALITIFEFVVFLVEPYFEEFSDGVPIFQLVMNIVLAISLNPVEYWVRGILRKKGNGQSEE